MTSLLPLSIILLETLNQLVDVIARSQEDGRALVNVVGLDVEDGTATVGGDASCLFDDEGHGVAFVQQPQLK